MTIVSLSGNAAAFTVLAERINDMLEATPADNTDADRIRRETLQFLLGLFFTPANWPINQAAHTVRIDGDTMASLVTLHGAWVREMSVNPDNNQSAALMVDIWRMQHALEKPQSGGTPHVHLPSPLNDA